MLALGAGTRAGAQGIRLRITEETTGFPLAGAIVDLLDASDVVVTQAILAADGSRQVPVPRAGSYRIRLRRIGYLPFVGAPVAVAGTGIVDVAFEVPARRVVLSAIKVTGRRCARDAFDDAGLATLWEEVRKALTSAMLTRQDSTVVTELRAFRRTLGDDREIIGEQVGLPRTTDARRPYVARPVEELRREGYVRGAGDGTEFYAPDEQVLLSDEFLADHCFEVARGSDATDGLLGVRFSPADRRNDVAGVLWVDPASAELRYLDFWYVYDRLPRSAAGEDRSGGQVVFERTAAGQWIVSAWRLRMPRVVTNIVFERGRPAASRGVRGYEEVGGVVTPPSTDSVPPSPVLMPYRTLLAPARITGTVFDSLANLPLSGAQVWLVPVEGPQADAAGLAPRGGRLAVVPVAATTDAAGRFALSSIPSGSYRLGFEHPDLDTLALIATRYDIRLRPGVTVVGDLGVPSLATLKAGCAHPAGKTPDPVDGVVFGVVRAVGDRRPLANALVRLSWGEISVAGASRSTVVRYAVETRTDSTGIYRLCGLPDSTMAMVQAAGPHSSTGEVEASIDARGISQVNLLLAEAEEGQAAPAPGAIAGTVADSLGHALANAVVTLDGATLEARTDDAGRFRLAGVMPGTQTLEVRRVGLDPVRRAVEVAAGGTTTVALTLARAQLLDAMLVTAERTRRSPQVADAVRRHRAGSGFLFTEQELARQPTLQAIIQNVPGVRVAPARAGAGGQWVALMTRRSASISLGPGECEARVFVDGHEADYDLLQSVSPDEVAALEVFVRTAQAPLFTTGRSIYGREETCGALVFWLKH